jgi:hypothetical protein
MDGIEFDDIKDNIEAINRNGLSVDSESRIAGGEYARSSKRIDLFGIKNTEPIDVKDKNGSQYYEFTSYKGFDEDGNEEVSKEKPVRLFKDNDGVFIRYDIEDLNSDNYVPIVRTESTTGIYVDETGIGEAKKVGGGKMRKHCKSGTRRNPKTKRCRAPCKSGTRRNPRSHLCRKIRSKK